MITSILNAKNLVKRVKRKINLKNTLRSDESLDSKWTFLENFFVFFILVFYSI